MFWRKNPKVVRQTSFSAPEVERRLEQKKERMKKVPIKGVIGKEKWTLERLKTKAYSLLDRLVTENFSTFEHIDEVFLFLEELKTDRESLETMYDKCKTPYPKKLRKRVRTLKRKVRMSRMSGNISFPKKLESELQEEDLMSLIRYLQSKLIAQQLLYQGISGIYLVRKFLLESTQNVRYKAKGRFKGEMKETKEIQTRLKQLQFQLKKEKQILSHLIQMEKAAEKDTFTIKRSEEEEWDEEEF